MIFLQLGDVSHFPLVLGEHSIYGEHLLDLTLTFLKTTVLTWQRTYN